MSNRGRGRPPADPDTVDNPLFVYEGPGYFVDRTGDRWLVGEDPDGDLVGINVLNEDPSVQYWGPCGRVPGAKGGHARDLVGPYRARRVALSGANRAMAFHRSN